MTGWDVGRYCDREILDAAPVGITICDHAQPSDPFVYVNERFLAMTGYDREEVLGASPTLLSGPETAEFRPGHRNAGPAERRLYDADGEPFRSSVRVVPLDDCGNHRLCFYEAVSDQRDGAVSLVDVTEACWDHLPTTGADLSVQTDKRVRADREPLGRLFEQLFQAAVEQGEAWSVTVGELGGRSGFYVEDDGAGTSATDALGAGATSAAGSGGRDLTPTVEIADEQGWDLVVSEHRTGGTRVELTGVDVVD